MVSKQFLTAGNAIFTVKLSPEAAKAQNRTHFTFKIRQKVNDDNTVVFFVSVLTGPDNTSDYTYLGILNVLMGQVRTTKKSCWNPETYGFKLLNRVLARIWTDDSKAITDAGFEVYHEGRCGRCGRPLTVPQSIETGIGPDCAEKMAA